jgi:LacI family transcriptional regulator
MIGVVDRNIIREGSVNMKLSSASFADRIAPESMRIILKHITPGDGTEVDGIIAFGNFSEKEISEMNSISRAVLFIDSDRHDYEYDRIVMDYQQGLEHMVSYLIDNKRYRTVGYLGGFYADNTVRIGEHRLSALKQILTDRGMYNDDFFITGEFGRESGFNLARRLIESGRLPEVLIIRDSEMAEGAIDAMIEAGIRIPKDVAVVIYRDIDTLRISHPTYTSLNMIPDSVWSTAAGLLKGRIIDGRTDAMTVYMPPRLEPGDST